MKIDLTGQDAPSIQDQVANSDSNSVVENNTLDSDRQSFYIKTFGCQMNEADTVRMSVLLSEQGLKSVDDASQADIVILNGCTVREKAVHKAMSALGKYNVLNRKDGKKRLFGMGGCVGQLEKETIFKKAPHLDFVFGTDAIDSLPEIVYRVRKGEKHVVYADFDRDQNFSTETKVEVGKRQAFVNIMKGCDKYCTYCIVPFTRGKEKSRVINEVLDDVARLVQQGVQEITLLGQNVNSFGKGNENVLKRAPLELHNPIGKVGPRAGEENFPQLLRALDSDPRMKDLKRIRFTSSHPLDFSDELIDCYRPVSEGGISKLCNQLHLPVQSGSNRVLQAMGRHHKIETYIEQMNRLRSIRPDIALSTDIIVGFPGETETEFEETIQLLDQLRYDQLFAFAYSSRPGTRASKLVDDVSDSDKRRRLNKVLDHQLMLAEGRYAEKVGQVLEVLVEGQAKTQNWIDIESISDSTNVAHDAVDEDSLETSMRNDKPSEVNAKKGVEPLLIWSGRTSCSKLVHFRAPSTRSLIGKFLNIKITKSSSVSLRGELVSLDSAHGIIK